MRHLAAMLPALLAAALLAPGAASAHPMGTLSTNRSAHVLVRDDETVVRYIVDFAEVPSVAELQRLNAAGKDAYAAARGAELLPALHLTAAGAPLALTLDRCFTSTAKGEGDLPIVSLFCDYTADAIRYGRVRLDDGNFSGTVGWREMRVVGDGVSVGDGSPPSAVVNDTDPLPYSAPEEAMRLASVEANIGVAGSVAGGRESAATKAPDAFAALINGDELSPRFVALALLSALVLGAGHALSPGHGKTVVAAYLVGSRGTVAQALALGLTVTATHVSSVLLLGAVTLWLSQYVVAAELYPWIGVASGVGVVGVGLGLFRSRLRAWRLHQARAEADAREMQHDHGHAHADHTDEAREAAGPTAVPTAAAEGGWLDHSHGPDGHEHIHRDARGEPVSLGRLLALGVTGGAVPCPSALVVLLSAIALHRILFGILLIVSFSIGLAGVLMAIGVMVVRAQGLLSRFSGAGRTAAWLPVASACVVMLLGTGIALQSAREGGLL